MKLNSRLGKSTTNTVLCTHRKAWKVLELLLDTRVGRLGRVQYTEPGLHGLRLTKPKETVNDLTIFSYIQSIHSTKYTGPAIILEYELFHTL